MRVPHLYYHEIAESDFSPTLVADDGDDEDEDEEEEEEEHRRDEEEEEEEEEPIWTASPSGRESAYRVEMDSMTRATILKVERLRSRAYTRSRVLVGRPLWIRSDR